MLDTARKLSEDVARLERENASLKPQINKLREKFGQFQGSSSCRFGLQADTQIAG
jgi:hypothetical protein